MQTRELAVGFSLAVSTSALTLRGVLGGETQERSWFHVVEGRSCSAWAGLISFRVGSGQRERTSSHGSMLLLIWGLDNLVSVIKK